MSRASRSVHVRKHLLNPKEKWNEISTLSAYEIRRLRADVEAAGCVCGPLASLHDGPGSAGHAIALDLFVRDYAPVSFLTLIGALEGVNAFAFRDGKERHLYVVSLEGLVVIAAGEGEIRWRTSYRVLVSHRPQARFESIRRRHRRALELASSLARQAGEEP